MNKPHRKTSGHLSCTPAALMIALVSIALMTAGPVQADEPPTPQAPFPSIPAARADMDAPTAPGQSAAAPPASAPMSTGAPSPSSVTAPAQLPAARGFGFSADSGASFDQATGDIQARGNVHITYADADISADRVEGNVNREVVFSGHARIDAHGTSALADAIHVYPRNNSYLLDNPRATLDPALLQDRVLDAVSVNGGEMFGTQNGYAVAERIRTTTCINPHPHYELRARNAELIPHKVLILRNVGVYLFGARIVVLPYLSIPLDERLRRYHSNYLPEFGQNINEGWYARFPYEFAVGGVAATLLRLDATQRLGEGYRIEEAYLAGKQQRVYYTGASGGGGAGTPGETYLSAYGYGTVNPAFGRLGSGGAPQNGGLVTVQGYFDDGFDRNFNASFRHQQGIGSNNRFSITAEIQNNSYLTYTNQSSWSTRFDFTHADPAHGVNADVSLNIMKSDSVGYATSQYTASARESFEFDDNGANKNTLTYGFNLARFASGSSTTGTLTEQLNTTFDLRHVARDYSWDLNANKVTDIESSSSALSSGTLEKLPELQFAADTINFKGGWLHQLPLHFDVGFGEYSEPSTEVQDARILLGATLQDVPILKGRTEMTTGGGFEQRLYGDGEAQYIVRNLTRMRRHLGGRSGVDLTYQYEQPEGGTPFQFDTFGRTHSITAEAGYLDDSRFQFTARAGYDMLGSSSANPWQSLSTRLMWRPTPSVRFDNLTTYDPNKGRIFGVQDILRLRGHSNFAMDLVTNYDPSVSKFSAINTQFGVPLGRSWQISSLLLYDGYTSTFSSTNFQLMHRWDCMEATLTYTQAPYGFQQVRSLFFTIHLSAFPYYRSFAHGAAGDIIGTGIGQIN